MRAEYFHPEATGDAWEIFRDEAEGEDKIRLSHPLWWNTRRPAVQKMGIEQHMAAEEAEYSAAKRKGETTRIGIEQHMASEEDEYGKGKTACAATKSSTIQRGIEQHMAAEEAESAAARSVQTADGVQKERSEHCSARRENAEAAPAVETSADAGQPATADARMPLMDGVGAGDVLGAGAPTELAAPYIWHVKDQEPLQTKRSVQAQWAAPYFARSLSLNAWEASESFEFWFSLPGVGTMAHGDAYCELTISLQLTGRKRWRLMMIPAGRDNGERLDTRDGALYTGVISQGEMGQDGKGGWGKGAVEAVAADDDTDGEGRRRAVKSVRWGAVHRCDGMGKKGGEL
jgi:hypothetical protein